MSSSNSKKRKSLSDDDESSSSSDQHEQKKPLDVLDHSELGKDLCLLKLPKELVQYQKENRNFRLNFKDIKSGEIFKINNIEYEASVTKIKSANNGVSFSCVCRSESGLIRAVDSFKYLVQVKRTIKLPRIEPPVVEKTKIGISPQILNYIKQMNK